MSDVVDPWLMQAAKPKGEPLPEGMYLATFAGVNYHMVEGVIKWRWAWTVKSGAMTGREASALTDKSVNPNTLPGRIVLGLANREIKTGENFKSVVDRAIGQTFMVSVQRGPQGGKAGVKSVGSPPPM